jgi:hypothetical protein
LGARKAPLVGGVLKWGGERLEVIVDNVSPSSVRLGAGSNGGGVAGLVAGWAMDEDESRLVLGWVADAARSSWAARAPG